MHNQNKQYLQIRNELAKQINNERYKVGNKLPSERELGENFNCTRVTIREALMQLAAEGLIYRRNRRGWFVAPPRLLYNPSGRTNFMEMTQRQNRIGSTVLVSSEEITASAQTCKLLALPPGSKILQVQRLRSLEDRPVLFENMFLSMERFPGLQNLALEKSITGLMRDHYNVDIEHESVRVINASIPPIATEALEVLPGQTGMCISRLRYERNKQPVELDYEYWLSDSIEIFVETHS